MPLISDSLHTWFEKHLPRYVQGFVPKLFRTLREPYAPASARRDLLAGITVAIVALPLSMALAIASGTTPDRGIFTAVVAGFIISFFGGSRFQIGGPTGAFVVVIYNIIEQYGYDGLVLATFMAGAILILAGLFRLGSFIKYIPYPVVTGFTAGIAVIIFSGQVKDLFGLRMGAVPADFVEKWQAYFSCWDRADAKTALVAFTTLAVMIAVQKFKPRWPSFLIGVVAGSVLVVALGLPVDTVGSKFGGVPSSLPAPHLPDFSSDKIVALFPSAFTIAFLAGIESLLSAVVADGMTGDRHLSNCELAAEGAANIASVIFGGIPATGAIARTATNIRSGAYSSVAGIVHAVVLLLFVLFASRLASYVPLAALAAVLVIVAWNMSGIDRIRNLMTAPRGDRFTLAVTFLLTIFVDLNTAIEVGVVMASLIFMRRMSLSFAVESNDTLSADTKGEDLNSKDYVGTLPDGVVAFNINGPLFFGAASQLTEFFDKFNAAPKIVILRMGAVPMMDATAVNIMTGFIKKCRELKIKIIICNAKKQPKNVLKLQIIQNRLNLSVAWTKYFAQALRLSETLLPAPAEKQDDAPALTA